jgi:two-component system, OmpR family, sensor histidine kinase TctE
VHEVPVRVLAIALSGPNDQSVIVKLGETRLKRKTLAAQVLWISVAISILLATVSAALIWFAIGRGMNAIERKVREVRSAHAAAPPSPIPLADALPQEVVPLVQEINDVIADLSAAHRLNERFIADAAHQLRTPLATLRVQLEVALREKDPERHRHAINAAVSALTRMARTLHQLLTLAKTDEAEATISSPGSIIDIELIAREEVERRLDDALSAGIDLGYAGTGKAVLVRGVDQLVREALANLLDNALRYGGAGARVTVGVVANTPELYVDDDGPGIPAGEHRESRSGSTG